MEAQVTLHEEHAEVVRRAISDPSYIKDIDFNANPSVAESVGLAEGVLPIDADADKAIPVCKEVAVPPHTWAGRSKWT